jgi:tetratricopeptide (TPR) repeat protein
MNGRPPRPRKRRWLFAAAFVLLAPPVLAAPGSRAADFLLLSRGPRVSWLAGAVTAVPAGAFCLQNNPAGLALSDYRELSVDYNRWISDVSQQSILYAHPRGRQAFAGGLLRQGVGSFRGYDAGGAPADDVSAEDYVLSGGWAGFVPLGESELAFGLAAKHIQSRLEEAKASALAADVGALYRIPLPFVKAAAGLSAQNVGQSLKFDAQSAPLPTVYRAGVSGEHRFYGDTFVLSIDVIRPTFDSRTYWAAGFEASVKGILIPRVGFESPQDLGNGFSFGLGLRLKTLQVDYAVGLLEEFGPSHRVGLTMRWGQPMEVSRVHRDIEKAKAHHQLGRQLLSRGRYLEAMKEFSKALDYDPTNTEIIRDMEKAFEESR